MKRILSLMLCLGLLCPVFSGCAAEDTAYIPTGDALIYSDAELENLESDEELEPQELTLAYYADRSLNPLESSDYTNRVLFSLIYQGLFSIGRDFKPYPILCSRYEISADYRSYIFYLENATFSDGSFVSVQDVLDTYTAAKSGGYYAGRLAHVREISLVEGGGIRFDLDTPMEDFLLLLDIPILKSSQVADPQPLGTGPYVLQETLTGYHLRRSINWWCKSPDLVVRANSIPLVAGESPNHIRDEFEFYDVGLVCADPCSDPYADYRCDYELWECENGIFLYLGVNVAYSQEDFFAEPAIRSLLTYAIDRTYLADEHYRGFARPTPLPMSPNCPYYSTGLADRYAYNPQKLSQAMVDVNLPDEPIQLLVNADDSLRLRTARDIAKMLTDCGLPTETVELETPGYLAAIKTRSNYDLYLGQTRLSPNMDLSPFFRPWGDLSYGGMSDAPLYVLCQEALDNHGNFYNLHQAVVNDGRLIPILFCTYAVYATRGLLTDLKPARDNVFFYTLGRTQEDALIPIDYTANDGGIG